MTGEYLLTPQTERDNRRKSAIITFFIVAAILIIAWWLRFGKFEVDFPPQGIMVQFGTTDFGSGPQEPAESKVVAAASTPEQTVEQEVETFETPDAVPVSPKPATTPSEKPSTTPTQTAPDPFKPKSVYTPGATGQGSSSSQGSTGGTGNMGDPLGSDDGAFTGSPSGTGIQGTGRSVGGRGWAQRPDLTQFHQVQEILKVNIYARKDGTITDVKVVGGTLADPVLIGKVIAQIKRGKLQADPSAPEIELLASWTIRFALD